MKWKTIRVAILGFELIILSLVVQAAVFPLSEGRWPESWPAELEPLRPSARTISVGTGIQQKIYEITFNERDMFERLWPVILSLKSRGAPLTLYRTGSAPPRRWDSLLTNEAPSVRIYAPSGGLTSIGPIVDVDSYMEKPRIDPDTTEKLLAEGKILRADSPWPDSIRDAEGHLPEFVNAQEVDGRLKWVPATLGEENVGFLSRARIDVELVVDGTIVDLNRILLPIDTPILDKREIDAKR